MDPLDPPELGPLETEVMDVVWRHAPVTVRDVVAALRNENDVDRAYTTIMTTCARLADKGMLLRTRDRRTDVYAAGIERDVYQQARTGHAVDALVDEVGAVALVHFVRRLDALDTGLRSELETLARRTRPSDG